MGLTSPSPEVMDASIARRMWMVGEPLHAVTYFARESFAAWEAAGLRGFWRGYFATRAAPFGPVGPEIVTASFFNFAPSMVRRALPGVWELATPADALAARTAGATAALRTILGDTITPESLNAAVALTRDAMEACTLPGRSLFAVNVALPWPNDPLAALWHGLTCLREHRGDGHNAVLVAAGLDGCEAHVLASAVAAGGAPRERRQGARGWTDDDWDAAVLRLADRGLVTDEGLATPSGTLLHADIEDRTDLAAFEPWRTLGPVTTSDLEALLRPWAELVVASGVVSFPNPMGLPPLTPR